ncbi:MAG: SusC/RagA family TonB-linked outer membrane protein [Bacteroidetes bacterium]|nr:MAG: SusC/RagA family TonB-linked outer membrane protein [Bacteroidota bacterium]
MKNLINNAISKLSGRFFRTAIAIVCVSLISLALTGENVQGQTLQIRGTVTDALTKESLPGVNVTIKNTTTGAATDIDGNYTLQAPADAVLVYSFMGYITEELPVEGRTRIDIQLTPSIDMLDEIIVIAYGTTSRSNLTGSAVSISSDDLKDVFAPRISGLIQGKAAGVYARSATGRPGQTAEINIRGKGSINTTNAPLWVVDGIAVGHTEPNLNPADIESITILKDASATALYGSRAANGVILVQTTSPKEGVSQLNFYATTGFTNLHRGNFSLMNSQQLYDYHSAWNTESWFNSNLLEVDTDWLDIATQTGVAQEYSMSYNGGTDKVSAYLSGTYYNEEAALKGYEYERYSAVANIKIKATDRLTLKANLTGNLINTDNREHSTYNAYTYMPWDHPYKENGTPIEPGTDTEYNWIGRDNSNYLYNLQYNWGTGRTNNLRLNMGADLEITDWLTFSSMNNISFGFGQSEWYSDPRSTGGRANNGAYNTGYSFSRQQLTNQMLRFHNSFDNHSFQAFVAWEYADTHSDNSSATGHGITAGLNVLNATASAAEVTGGKFQSARQSVLVNLQYVFDDKYMGTASFNREGSSSFGRENQYGNFWSFSTGWNMHYEDFMADIDWVNVLKLTASYGEVGNSPSGFPHLGYYELTGQYAGIPAARPYQIANPFITWEKSTTVNFGLETRLFNRITANAEIYERDNSGLLYYVPLTALTGYTGVWDNIGRIRNRGVELSLQPEVIKTKDFQWNINFNVAFNRNQVMELYDGQPITSGNIRIAEENDMDSYFMRVWHGVDPGNGQPLWERIVENEDGTQSVELTNNYANATLQFTGQTMSPDYTGGIINTFRYKDFSLSANIGFVQGVYMYNSDRQLFDSDGNYPTFNQMNLADGWSRWEKPGDDATHPKAIIGGNRDANRPSTRFLEDASFVRLRNITFAYHLPGSLNQQLGFSSARIYLSADNVYTFTEWSGMDPETGGLYPLTQRFMLGLQIQL